MLFVFVLSSLSDEISSTERGNADFPALANFCQVCCCREARLAEVIGIKKLARLQGQYQLTWLVGGRTGGVENIGSAWFLLVVCKQGSIEYKPLNTGGGAHTLAHDGHLHLHVVR